MVTQGSGMDSRQSGVHKTAGNMYGITGVWYGQQAARRSGYGSSISRRVCGCTAQNFTRRERWYAADHQMKVGAASEDCRQLSHTYAVILRFYLGA